MVGSLDSGSRFVALVPPDAQLLEEMTVHDPIGQKGSVTSGTPTNQFKFSL